MINIIQIIQMANQIRQNPTQWLAQNHINMPQNINKPEDMVQYILNNGMRSQSDLNNAFIQANQFGLKK